MSLLFVLVAVGCDAAKAPPATAPPATSSTPGAEQAAGPAADARGVNADDEAPGVTLQIKDYDAIVELIKSHQGKVVVVDCWSTWCEPCMKEFPGLVALDEKFGPDKVACISLSLDFEGIADQKPEESEAKVLKFLRSQRAAFDNVLSSTPADELSKRLKFASPPTVFVYDRQGELAKKFEGPDARYETTIVPFVAQLVETSKSGIDPWP
ncbi:MAG TPA: TlpA disulfide reductase family protein [Pirellulales bacterium]|nr:TlpA disulfide reductase family protein [Pirellulales bacterium]